MPRFFVNPEAIEGTTTFVAGDDAYHIARSLRMAVGDQLTVSDGAGTDYLCRLSKIRDDRCDLDILSSKPGDGEPPYSLTLYMAYPKGDKLETVIQKAVELGATAIVPFESSRCIKRPKAEREEKQTARLVRIAGEAAKQCGRSRLPAVGKTLSYAEVLKEAAKCDLPLFCYEGKDVVPLGEWLSGRECPRSVCAVVGSEGGFSPEEANAAKAAGLIPVGLGPRILRCETAPAYVLAALSFFYETGGKQEKTETN